MLFLTKCFLRSDPCRKNHFPQPTHNLQNNEGENKWMNEILMDGFLDFQRLFWTQSMFDEHGLK
jgi:hypothetical protein